MNEHQKIEQTIRKKEQEIHNLEERVKAAKVYVKALRDVQKMLAVGSDIEPAQSMLRQGSAVAQARSVILDCGTPMHISDLLVALGKQQTREARASLASSLSAYVRRGEIFSRTAPNTFGLIELDHNSETEKVPEPPSGFGRISLPTTLSYPETQRESPESPPKPDDDDIPPF